MSARRERIVRPRWVWGGTLTSLAGLGAVSVGVVVLSWVWAVVGLLTTVAGALLAWWAGVLRDVHTSGPLDEVDQVTHGTVRRGVAPGDTVPLGSGARERVAGVEVRRRELERRGWTAPTRPPTRPAGVLLVLVAVFLLVAQWGLYPLERPGQTNAVRALGAAVLLGLVAARLFAVTDRVPRVSTAVGASVGVALLLNGALARHDRTATAAAEVVCGVLVCLVGAALLLWRRR